MQKTLYEGKKVQRGNVLIVDDDADIVGTLQVYLSENGYKTLGCISARGALDAIKKYGFDILLVDLVMPEMNGIEILKAALKIDPYLIGIIITGQGTMESAIHAMKAGAFDYLLKPFKFDMLSPIFDRAMTVRKLMKSEDKHRSVVQELKYKAGTLQNDHTNRSGEFEVLELREQVAIGELKTHDFEVMLTDLMMPEMNGVELLKYAKELDPHLMGIILTGKGTIETTTEMMKEATFLCSLKPFSFKMMQMMLSCALKKRRLTKLEEKYRQLNSEHNNNVGDVQNANEKNSEIQLELIAVKEEIANLKKDQQCYEYLEKHWAQSCN